jgi:16S rRNA (cytosine967-C5)-methyltransferase
VSARDVAFEVVRDVFGPELRGAQAAFDVRSRRAGLDARDRGFAAELAYGSIKQRRLIDWYLGPYVGGREKPLPPAILEVLRLGVYQLRFMSGTEDHAAVSETVNLAWRHGHKGTAGLVNAVLRRMIADGPLEPDPTDYENENDYAGVRFSVPTWVAAQFGRSYDGERDAALAGVNAAPQHAISVNTLRAEPATIVAELAERGITASPSRFVAETLLLDSGSLGDDPTGRWSIQGEAAAMPVDVLAPRPGETILEFCGGRGNKTLQLAARSNGLGNIVTIELDEKKLRVMRAHLERAGITNVAIVHGDARIAAEEVRADAVLLDAPCSGLGVIGRHPEARWRKTPNDGARLAEGQDELLRAAAARTAPGGRLVYSVCSSDPREGRERIENFLAEDAAFSRSPLPERYAEFERGGDLIVPAGIEGRDGFYIASLVRA